MNLVDVLRESAENFSRKPFIIFGAKKVTFGELDELSSKLAVYLKARGLRKSDKVSLWLHNCPEFVIAAFAVLKAGGIVVPVNNMLKRDEAKFIVEDSGAKILVCAADKLEDSLNIKNRIQTLETIISFKFPRKVYPPEEVAALYRILGEVELKDYVPEEISEDDIAEILYTSGTTGRPKGACLTHRNLISNIEDCAVAIEVKPKDVFIAFLPLFHSFASTVCIYLPLYKGASTVIFRAVRPFKRVIRSILKNKISVFVGVPSMYALLKDVKLPKILDNFLIKFLLPVRLCISGAAALPPNIIGAFEKKLRVPLIEGYGLTETSPVVSLNPYRGKRKPGSIGLPITSVKVKVVDKEGKTLGPDEVGELLVKGPNVMKGYLNLEEETRQALREGWLYTGDLAKIDEEGYIYIVGRLKEMINVRGLNVYPREIEEALYQHPAVKEAAIVGVNHPHKGEVPVGFVVAKEGHTIDSRSILNFLKEKIASYKVPLTIEMRESLPKNATGKILKFVLQEEAEKKYFKKSKDK